MSASKSTILKSFLLDALDAVTKGGIRYHIWMATLTMIMLIGAYAYSIQLEYGLQVTGMNDHVSWGLYISNFTFCDGIQGIQQKTLDRKSVV